MVYESLRINQKDMSVFSPTIQDKNGAVAERAKELNLADDKIVKENSNVGKQQILLRSDENKNKIEDSKELPSVVEQEKSHQSADGRKKDGFEGDVPQCQCEKCRARRYKDGSDDNMVSYQMPTRLHPKTVKSKVMAHEMEHVRNEQLDAKSEGKKILSQSVRIMTDVCEECGSIYVKGGYTRTISRPDMTEFRKLFSVGAEQFAEDEFDSIA